MISLNWIAVSAHTYIHTYMRTCHMCIGRSTQQAHNSRNNSPLESKIRPSQLQRLKLPNHTSEIYTVFNSSKAYSADAAVLVETVQYLDRFVKVQQR